MCHANHCNAETTALQNPSFDRSLNRSALNILEQHERNMAGAGPSVEKNRQEEKRRDFAADFDLEAIDCMNDEGLLCFGPPHVLLHVGCTELRQCGGCNTSRKHYYDQPLL